MTALMTVLPSFVDELTKIARTPTELKQYRAVMRALRNKDTAWHGMSETAEAAWKLKDIPKGPGDRLSSVMKEKAMRPGPGAHGPGVYWWPKQPQADYLKGPKSHGLATSLDDVSSKAHEVNLRAHTEYSAKNRQGMIVSRGTKDKTKGLDWVDPVTNEKLPISNMEEYVAHRGAKAPMAKSDGHLELPIQTLKAGRETFFIAPKEVLNRPDIQKLVRENRYRTVPSEIWHQAEADTSLLRMARKDQTSMLPRDVEALPPRLKELQKQVKNPRFFDNLREGRHFDEDAAAESLEPIFARRFKDLRNRVQNWEQLAQTGKLSPNKQVELKKLQAQLKKVMG